MTLSWKSPKFELFISVVILKNEWGRFDMISEASSLEFRNVFTRTRWVFGSLSGEIRREGDCQVVATYYREVPRSIIMAGRIDSLKRALLFRL